MEEMLRNINLMKKNNTINKLKQENEKKDNKIKKIAAESKQIVNEYNEKSHKIIEELRQENTELKRKVNDYEEAFNKIPKIILNFFVGGK